MITVFVWPPTDENAGHAACNIRTAGSREVYVSWWPLRDGEVKFGDRAHVNRKFKHDRNNEGRDPAYRIELSGGFEGSAIQWWEDFLRHSRWSVIGANCSWVVAQILQIAFPPYNTIESFAEAEFVRRLLWMPMDVATYAWLIQQRLRASATSQQRSDRIYHPPPNHPPPTMLPPRRHR